MRVSAERRFGVGDCRLKDETNLVHVMLFFLLFILFKTSPDTV